MKTSLRLCVVASLFLACIHPRPLRAQAITHLDETTEWTWSVRPNPINPALPNVLLIGDSITRNYYPQVVKQLAGKANCFLFATSAAAGDPRLPHQIDELFSLYPEHFAVIHFNNGMHGWSYTEPQWSAGMTALVAQLHQKAPTTKLIWTTITPVLNTATSGATNPRIDTRNQLALTLMQAQHILIDDQHALMLNHQDLHADPIHFNAAGSDIQSKQVVETITALMPNASH